MTNEMLENVEKVLIICAHSDDETIFCGGAMLTYPKIEWEILCLNYGQDDSRRSEFENAMKLYKKFGVNIVNYGYFDKGRSDFEVVGSNPSVIITHNSEGEYGHEHHKHLNRAIHSNFPESDIWEFICPGSHKIAPQPFKERVAVVPLTREILAKKTEIFNTCYKSQLETWRARPDVMLYEFWSGPEMFTSNG